MDTIGSDDVRKLLELFASSAFKPRESDKSGEFVQKKCVSLFQKDYVIALIANDDGALSTSYPSQLIVPISVRKSEPSVLASGENLGPKHHVDGAASDKDGKDAKALDAGKLRELMCRARVARCRARFPVPVILLDGKYVCRSATLSGGPEIYGRSGLDLLFSTDNDDKDIYDDVDASVVTGNGQTLSALSSLSIGDSSHVFSKVRSQDITLLKYLRVQYICDLMVEKKKVKFGVK